MENKILFFGTSHLAAIKLGYDSLASDGELSGVDADFIGVNGPGLLSSISDGWKIYSDKVLSPPAGVSFFASFVPDGRSPKEWANLSFVSDINIDLTNYNIIVFVDIFHGWSFVRRLKVDESGILYFDGTPVSQSMLLNSNINAFRGAELVNHSVFNNVGYQHADDLLALFTKAGGGNKKYYLLPSPKPMQSNINVNRYGSDIVLKNTLSCVDGLYKSMLGSIGVSYISQPSCLCCDKTGLTLDKYSRGENKRRPGLLDPHANIEYGRKFISEVIGLLGFGS